MTKLYSIVIDEKRLVDGQVVVVTKYLYNCLDEDDAKMIKRHNKKYRMVPSPRDEECEE